jgi:hypothetical protein
VTLSADIRSFTAGKEEPEVWADLKCAVQARRWPALARPAWLVAFLWVLSLGTFCGLIPAVHWGVAAACGVLAAVVAIRLTQSCRWRIPGRYSELRKLVPFVATSDAIAWTRDQVAALVKKLVIENLDLREKDYREDAQFVRDLGMS